MFKIQKFSGESEIKIYLKDTKILDDFLKNEDEYAKEIVKSEILKINLLKVSFEKFTFCDPNSGYYPIITPSRTKNFKEKNISKEETKKIIEIINQSYFKILEFLEEELSETSFSFLF